MMIILGIDPGLASTGFGAIEYKGKTPTLIKCGYIKTSTGNSVASRLFQIYNDMEQLIRTIQPNLIAFENVFSLVRYPKAGILLGGVLGVIFVSAQQNNVELNEISPKEAKNALVGFGNANKSQIKNAVQKLLGINDVKSFHASDALAVALTAFYRNDMRSKFT
jgi:crossover junction endodeoxyribonuclease RuvC